MKFLKFLLGCLIFFAAFSIVVAAYEKFTGGPWYTYVDSMGVRLIMGQDVRTTYPVYDTEGKLIDNVPGWKFEGQAPNSYVKDAKGELHFKDPVKLPQWMEITDTVLQPFLTAGHLVVDNVVAFFRRLT